ncbi:50S ribosomal protein L17 [Mucor ambiguus]|uniref:Large ribosomal subunit protein bL17c n=1 Tax=Mucor ambiguus TaxID=91626 RepID=A0A0C9LVB6_9FUNG|nr:50S ribosomal protein L17 [Mucor ambiguus]
MHHGKHLRRLNRTSGHRNSLLRNMVSSLVEHGRIETTVAKAKTIQPIADSIITLGKKGDVEAKKQALAYLNSRDITMPKLFEELAPRFANRQGGYTRIQRIGKRYGDNAPMAIIEYIDGPTDTLRETVTSTLARKFSETQKVSVKDILETNSNKVQELGLPKTLVRNLKKVQFANSLESIDQAIEKKMGGL